MALTASKLFEIAHKAVRNIGGVGATFTFEDTNTASGVILSEMEPGPEAGLVEGMTDATRVLRCAILSSERATAPAEGELITIGEAPFAGIDWHVTDVVPALTQGEHRFNLVEGPAS